MRRAIVVTAGEPAGIGPDLCLDLLNGDWAAPIVVVGARAELAARARRLGTPFAAADYSPGSSGSPLSPAARMVWDCPLGEPATAGKPSPKNAAHALEQLRRAAEGCARGDFAAMTTAPICKETILAAGHAFCGQTEHIANLVGAPAPLMTLAGPRLRVALATTHLPLRDVPAALTTEKILAALATLRDELPRRFDARRPPIVRVCGLNPHAGEGGHFGDEERTIIAPAVEEARRQGMRVSGPFSADAVLRESLLPDVDCVLAMYHDQALPAVKLLDFDATVNATLGLPFLRTSPDHGIAADLAGTGKARPDSMRAALTLAMGVA